MFTAQLRNSVSVEGRTLQENYIRVHITVKCVGNITITMVSEHPVTHAWEPSEYILAISLPACVDKHNSKLWMPRCQTDGNIIYWINMHHVNVFVHISALIQSWFMDVLCRRSSTQPTASTFHPGPNLQQQDTLPLGIIQRLWVEITENNHLHPLYIHEMKK